MTGTGSAGPLVELKGIHKAFGSNVVLNGVDLAVSRGEAIVIAGPSGSGKSTLAFDILFSEGQRRYLESLNAYARQFVQTASRPDVDAIFGIPPTVAIEQRTSRGGRKSTVATLTEIYHFLRLLYVKTGTQHCPYDDTPIAPQSAESIAARLLTDFDGRRIVIFSGGPAKGDQEIFEEARGIRDGGGFGSIMGRNSFQRKKPDAVKFLDTIMRIYSGELK